jgi:DNA-binding transcriptional LysR family regulator
MLDLRRLRYFTVVASERNFTRAAERLHIAQPALSRQVRQLEHELGVELLHRTTHSVELTEAGRELLERGSRVLDDVDALWRTMRGFGAGSVGTVVVAYGTSAGYDTAPRLLRAIAERLPELEVTTRVLPVGEIVSGLSDGSVDIGVVRCPPATPGADQRLLWLEPQGVLVRADHPLAGGEAAAIDDLAEPVLLHSRAANPGHYDAVKTLIGDAPLELRDVSFDLAQTPVLEGRAVAIVGESTRVGLPAELAWVRLEPPVAFPVKLLARSLDRPPSVERLLVAAEEIADELGWRTAMP